MPKINEKPNLLNLIALTVSVKIFGVKLYAGGKVILMKYFGFFHLIQSNKIKNQIRKKSRSRNARLRTPCSLCPTNYFLFSLGGEVLRLFFRKPMLQSLLNSSWGGQQIKKRNSWQRR
jgi:hypothetical protein